MIVYSGTKEKFKNDVFTNDIGNIILDSYRNVTGRNTTESEIKSWSNSLQYMDRVLDDSDIPNDAGIAIEYHIPQSSKRIDFIVTGVDSESIECAVLIELKQWDSARLTGKDGIVSTRYMHGEKEVPHPSYQAWSYKRLLEDFNATVEDEKIQLHPCAYLHNYAPDSVITNECFEEYTRKAPVFLKPDALKLRQFIKQHVRKGDQKKILYRIEHGRIRPSKNLADELTSLLKGNQEFVMIDDQKVVYEEALKLAKQSSEKNKNVLIVEGGPGTGKTVLAMNLLVKLTEMGLVAQYVTRNSAPREVYQVKLTGSFRQSHISNMFSGSGSFHGLKSNTFGALVVDEAHRLSAKSGMFNHLGENQVKEIVNASKFSIFFIDEDQRVTLKDIGEKSEIAMYAQRFNAKVTTMSLESQFRCNGSDGYIAWLDDILGIHNTVNQTLEGINYDFRIFDNPEQLHEVITEKNREKNKARMVAGYCWKWISKKAPNLRDIVIGNYAATWNLDEDGQAWIIRPESVSEVGCIHTCQGLEVDYIGVIVGPDLIMRDGELITVPEARASTDKSVLGWKKMAKEEGKETTRKKLDQIIKNTYRTLMTRGQKGCYVYFHDKELEKFFRSRLNNLGNTTNEEESLYKKPIRSPITKEMIEIPLVGSAPCGSPLLGEENIQEYIPVEKSKIKSGFEYFVLRAEGDSMNMAGINDRDLVLCKQQLKAETGDRVVALLGGENVTIKEYGPRENGIRLLIPRSTNRKHKPITPEDGDSVQGVVQEVLPNE
jgi:DUF2075 family protein